MFFSTMKKSRSAVLLFIGTLLLMLFIALVPKDSYKKQRDRMVTHLQKSGIDDQRVLAAMRMVERHMFVPEKWREDAYENRPLPIGEGQTISQPFVVAYMTQELLVDSTDRVLEIGTGSGYQAAILAQIVDSVFTIEIKPRLAEQAAARLQSLDYTNIKTRCADGYFGWPEHAPFDAIIITCAVNHVPGPLLEQLRVGGHMILPLGSVRYYQILTRIEKTEDGYTSEYLSSVAFVPMTGRAQK